MRALLLLSLATLALTAIALISCLSVEDESEIRRLPRFLWVILIVVAPLVGSIAWFVAGRPQRAGAGRIRWPVGGGFPERPRPTAPDDDPEFLRALEQRNAARSTEEELLRQWEEDLQRREDEHRRDPGTDG